MLLLFATTEDSLLLPLLIGGAILVSLLLIFGIVLILPRRHERRKRRRIRIPAMQETVRPEKRKERTETTADAADRVAIMAAALSVATEYAPGKSFRVVSFRRIR